MNYEKSVEEQGGNSVVPNLEAANDDEINPSECSPAFKELESALVEFTDSYSESHEKLIKTLDGYDGTDASNLGFTEASVPEASVERLMSPEVQEKMNDLVKENPIGLRELIDEVVARAGAGGLEQVLKKQYNAAIESLKMK